MEKACIILLSALTCQEPIAAVPTEDKSTISMMWLTF